MSTYATLPLGGAVFAVLAVISSAIGLAGRETLALLLDAGTFVFSALMVSGVPLKAPARSRLERFDLSRIWRDIMDGLRFLREDSIASAMTAGIVIAFAAVGAVLALGPIFVNTTLHAKAAGWGVVVVAFGVGMAIGMAGSNQVTKFIERELVFTRSLLSAAGALFLLAAMPTFSLAAVVTVWLGLFCGLAWVSGYTLLQENVEDEYRGRTFASLTVLSRLGLFASLTFFPILSSAYDAAFHPGTTGFVLSGTRVALWAAGLLVLAAGLNTRRLLHRFRLSRPQPLTLVPKLKRPPATGLFIAFEGVEGAGKGTQIGLAEEYLRGLGLDVLVTREPGGTELGERVRQLLLDPNTGKLDARAEALLFAASRAQTVTTIIRPALGEGKTVICDRYVDSSLAYQGWARGLGEQDVLTLNVWATQGLFPDLVVLLHVEPELGLLRSTEAPDRMELEGQDFHAKVSDAYLKIAEEHPERFVGDRCRSPAGGGLREREGSARPRVEGSGRGRPPGDGGSGRTGRVASPRERRPRSGTRAGCRHGVPDRRRRASAPRLRVRGARGLRQVDRGPGVRRRAPVRGRRLRSLPGLSARARGSSPQRVPGRARGPRHPRGHHP